MTFEDGVKQVGLALAFFVGGFIFPFFWIVAAILALSWLSELFGTSDTTQRPSGNAPPSSQTPPKSKPPVQPLIRSAANLPPKKTVLTVEQVFKKEADSNKAQQLDQEFENWLQSSPSDSSAARFMSRFKPNCFYHFTDTRNLSSIQASGGLLSMKEMRRMGISPSAAGGSKGSQISDIRNRMDEYVHLCLLGKNPMEFRAKEDGRIEESVFLEIDTSILSEPGILLTPGFSNRIGIVPVSLEKAIDEFDFEIIYGGMDWNNEEHRRRHNNAWRYEILVPNKIPLAKIRNWSRVVRRAPPRPRTEEEFSDDDIPF